MTTNPPNADIITTFVAADLRLCAPLGQTRNGGRLLLVHHPAHGKRWIRLSDWREALPPRRTRADLSTSAGAVGRRSP